MLFLCSVISLGELEAKSLQKNHQVGISKYSVAKIQKFLHSRQFFFHGNLERVWWFPKMQNLLQSWIAG